jgi:hypothetical protein
MSADLLRRAAAKLRDSHRYDGIKVDSDSKETLLLLRDLLAARDSLADLLVTAAERHEWFTGSDPESRLISTIEPETAVARAILGEVTDV